MTVVLANVKGGCGKSTIATSLAAALATTGAKVALADADPQRSSLTWLLRRPIAAAPIHALDWTQPANIGKIPQELRPLDWVIIDAPGSTRGARIEQLCTVADLILTPMTPSFFDTHATQRFLMHLENVEPVREGRASMHIIANRIRNQSALDDALSLFLERFDLEPAAEFAERSAYPNLAEQGLSIFDRESQSLAPLKAQWHPLLELMQRRMSAATA
ncbi:MAG: ParA family protein [Neomegalonema sp.]|nr:ParA family protein [Neomegalonema sp.]